MHRDDILNNTNDGISCRKNLVQEAMYIAISNYHANHMLLSNAAQFLNYVNGFLRVLPLPVHLNLMGAKKKELQYKTKYNALLSMEADIS